MSYTAHITTRNLTLARAIAAELALGGNVNKARARAAGYGFVLSGKSRGEVMAQVDAMVRELRGSPVEFNRYRTP